MSQIITYNEFDNAWLDYMYQELQRLRDVEDVFEHRSVDGYVYWSLFNVYKMTLAQIIKKYEVEMTRKSLYRFREHMRQMSVTDGREIKEYELFLWNKLYDWYQFYNTNNAGYEAMFIAATLLKDFLVNAWSTDTLPLFETPEDVPETSHEAKMRTCQDFSRRALSNFPLLVSKGDVPQPVELK